MGKKERKSVALASRKQKAVLWISALLLLSSCAPKSLVSSPSSLSREEAHSSAPSPSSSKRGQPIPSSPSSVSSSAPVSSGEDPSSSNPISSSTEPSSRSDPTSSSEEPSSSPDTRDWGRLASLLEEAKGQKERVDQGGLLLSQEGEDVEETKSFVTPTMLSDLERAIAQGESLTLSSTEEEFLAALNALESALDGFVPAKGKKAKEKTFQDVLEELSSGSNKNVASYVREGQSHAILWVNGILPPRRGEGDAFQKETWGDYVYEYAEEGQGSDWSDVNKIDQAGAERLLCYAAASANQLHWFFHVNQKRISSYLTWLGDHPLEAGKKAAISSFVDSYHGQQDSFIYHTVFRSLFSSLSYAYHTDVVNDYVLNGYPPPLPKPGRGI